MTDKNPIVIVGSGLAGYMVAKEFRKLNTEQPLVMLTKGDGHYYSKPQLSTALTHKRDPDTLSMGSPEAMQQQLNMDIYTGCVIESVDTDKHQIVCGDKTFYYDRLVLAVGADKMLPPLTGDAIDDVQSVNHLDEYVLFREWLKGKKHIAIIGAGLVACEFANDLLNEGYQVDVIAPDTYPLMRFVPQAMGQVLQAALAETGVNWHLGRFAKTVNVTHGKVSVGLDNQQTIAVDGVFSATGLTPHLALAQQLGLVVNRGIVVNRQLQTSAPDIYALGDCAEVNGHLLLHIAPILACARTLAQTLNGQAAEVSYPAMPIIVKTPCCPIVTVPPEEGLSGEWAFEGEGIDIQGLCHDDNGQLIGFVLSGKCISRRQQLIKELPALFN